MSCGQHVRYGDSFCLKKVSTNSAKRVQSVRMLGRPPVTHAAGSSTTLGTVDGLRDFLSCKRQITHDQASAGGVGSQDHRILESLQVSKDNDAVEKVVFLNIWKKSGRPVLTLGIQPLNNLLSTSMTEL